MFFFIQIDDKSWSKFDTKIRKFYLRKTYDNEKSIKNFK